VRLALGEAIIGATLTVLAFAVATGGPRTGLLLGGLIFLGLALIAFAVHWYLRGRTVRVDAQEHYLGRTSRTGAPVSPSLPA
jgi:hypothetical protein